MRDWLRDLGLLWLRLGFAGLMAASHGWGKLSDFIGGETGFPDPLGVGSRASLGLAALGEFVFAVLVAVGLFTRWTVLPVLGTMVVAFFVYHAGDPLGEREMALLYLVGLVAVLLLGPGRWSVDGWRRARKSN